MLITVNGATRDVADDLLLTELLPGDRRGTAVALNDVVVARHAIDVQVLSEGDRIEIVTAVQGG